MENVVLMIFFPEYYTLGVILKIVEILGGKSFRKEGKKFSDI